MISIVTNAFSANVNNRPDSPVKFRSNTWDEQYWTEIDVSIDGKNQELETALQGIDPLTCSLQAIPAPERDKIINLSSSDPTRAMEQPSITIHAGNEKLDFNVSIMDDKLFNESCSINNIASAPVYYTGAGNITIEDNDMDINFLTNVYQIPDSPPFFEFNTWDEFGWTEIDVGQEGVIVDWAFNYSLFNIDDFFPLELFLDFLKELSFHLVSPSGSELTFDFGDNIGSHTKTSTYFNGESGKGKWRLWIESNFPGLGIAQAVNISMNIVTATNKYLDVKIPESAVEGSETITGTLQSIPPPEKDMIVHLTSSAPNKAMVQPIITIPAGSEKVSFDFSIVDDDFCFDGSYSIKIIATAPDYYTGTDNIIVEDNDIFSNVFNIPDSPLMFVSNTWEEHSWIEIDVPQEGPIVDWSINYTWLTDYLHEPLSFEVLSPSDTIMTIAFGNHSGIYTITSTHFKGEPAKGKWVLWIENFIENGGGQAVNVSMKIGTANKYLSVTIPNSAVEGSETITGTLQSIPPPEKDMIVHLTSSAPNKAMVQPIITIPAGNEEVQFYFSIEDDYLFNVLSNSISIIATASGYYTGIDNIAIDDTASFSILLPENNFVGDQGIILVDRPAECSFEIILISSNPDILTIPETILFPEGITEVNFPLEISGLGIAQTISIKAILPNGERYSDSIYITPCIIPLSERNALIDLYNSTGGENWCNKDNWLGEHGTECSWFGISCYECHINEIELAANNLIGDILNSISNLQYLSRLVLHKNQLNGLPENFGNLQYINDLDLSYNQLSSLPDSFGNLKYILLLDLSYNQLSSLPESFGNLKHILLLHLSNNQLVSLPENFWLLSRFSDNFHPDIDLILDLSNNQLTYLPEFNGIQRFVGLYLSNNQLRSLPESFLFLNLITFIDLSKNQLSKLPEEFSSLSELDYLDLSNNQLDNLPQYFEKLKNINYLDISINNIKTLPTDIGTLTKLEYFNISKNEIEIIPESIGKCSILSTLNLSNNNIEIIPSSIGALKVLQNLNVSKNKIEEVPETLKHLSNLQKIDISYNIIEKFPYQLSNIKSLQEIDLSYNRITEIKDDIQYFTNLLALNLSYNRCWNYFFHISDKIEMLINLQSLALSNCNLTNDEIPSALFNLINLRYLSLSDNDLKYIPEHIDNLTNLISLSLKKNHIRGNINKSLCNLLNLRSLDLSGVYSCNNPMQGDIPLEFSKLDKLVYLDLTGTELYTTSPALEKFITDINPNWINSPPEKIERYGNCINFITTTSDHLGYSLQSEIPISIVMTQPVSLMGGDLIISLETGETDTEIRIQPFAMSYTATGIYCVQEGDFSEDLNVKSIRLSNSASLTNEYGFPVDLSLIQEINLAAMKNVYVDGTIPSIQIDYPNTICVDQLDKIKGSASDISKDFSVELTILDEHNSQIFNDIKYFFNNINEYWDFTPPQSIEKNKEYTIIAKITDFAGNTNTSKRVFSYGMNPSTITCTISKNAITFGERITISGRISPASHLIDAGVSIDLISPRGIVRPMSASANIEGNFSYHTACNDMNSAGNWAIRTSWEGNDCLLPAISNTQKILVDRAISNITLDLTSDAIKVGDTISIGGLFSPNPYCGDDLTGKDILLLIGNAERMETHIIQTNDPFGHFQLKDYENLTQIGDYSIQAVYQQDDTYYSDSSEPLKLKVLESAGYAIIVQGSIASDEGTASYSKTTMFVRNQLESRGIQDDEEFNDIMYFSADDSHPKIDAKPDKKAIQETIEKWASKRMNERPGDLYIVMVNHGLEEKFFIDPEVITSQDLKQWLDELQNLLSPQALEQHIVLILGFCYSGSFIDDVSGYHRIVITSAAADEFSYKGPLDKDNIREGEFFVSEFFKKIALGKSIGQSFMDAVELTEKFTESNAFGSINAPPYFDRSEQHPLLDDSGDGIGTNNLQESPTDGKYSKNFVIGVSSITHNDPGDVALISVAPTIFLDDENQFSDDYFWATVNNNERTRTIWIEIKSPEYDVQSTGTGQKELILPKILGTYNIKTSRYEWHWDEISKKEDFSIPGQYQVFYFAKDNISENVSPFLETNVYRNSKDNHWPQPFQLKSPANDTTITSKGAITYCNTDSEPNCYTLFSWTESNDPDQEIVTYSILLSSEDETFSDELHIIENSTHTIAPVSLPDIWDGLTIYWKVRAVDPKGGRYETEIYHFNVNNFGNPAVGHVKGYVSDAKTGKMLEDASLRIVNRVIRLTKGYYFFSNKPKTYPITASCPGYMPYEGNIEIVLDSTKKEIVALQASSIMMGDIDGNQEIDLKDAILALRAIAGFKDMDTINLNADVNGDGQIGEGEVLYILRH